MDCSNLDSNNTSQLSESAAMLTRCFDIARECLAGDPFRTVPTLELETDRLALEYQGRELTQADIDEANECGHLPAHLVADNALGLAGELASEVANG